MEENIKLNDCPKCKHKEPIILTDSYNVISILCPICDFEFHHYSCENKETINAWNNLTPMPYDNNVEFKSDTYDISKMSGMSEYYFRRKHYNVGDAIGICDYSKAKRISLLPKMLEVIQNIVYNADLYRDEIVIDCDSYSKAVSVLKELNETEKD